MSVARKPEEPQSLEFTPSAVDEAAARAEVERLAEGLRHSVDEAVGHPLDNLINAWSDKWVADAEAEHATYLARVEAPLGAANTRLNELDVVRTLAARRVDETEQARSAAVATLDNDKPLLGGRPRATYLHVLALLFTAGADVAAFILVVNRMGGQTFVNAMLVVGLSVCVLYLAHTAGTLVHKKKYVLSALCLVVWLAVGLLVAWIRLITPSSVRTQGKLTLGTSQRVAENPDYAYAGAGMFLALYIGGGLAACIGAYLTHHEGRSSFVATVRANRRAADQLKQTEGTHGDARKVWQAQVAARDAAAKVLAQQVARRRALAEELKQYARVLFAQKARDPSVTDAILAQDHRPYDYTTNGSSGRPS
ncbi:hypothetical protein BBK82_21740 [Lentzea guizhouensis]|uniref:Uncharacterized protein n=1 Tax=Lentzea guizhouensis TaxID=1586287 RepID=A0A1B2HKQ3_9PSEU|nr:hypothetical protein [Lentzea guizhouensis]ANZ38296.1 hypothetical protein BBK82_21740 [Lentzea guizhouensis]